MASPGQKVVLITGCSSGIGLRMAVMLAKDEQKRYHGIGLVGPVESIPMDEMKKVFETNFYGVIRMIKEVMPDMKRRRGGHIIVVSSVMGLQGPVHTEFELKMIEDVKKKEFPGADPETIHYFKNVYLPSSVDIFEMLGQTPDDIARCTKKVTEASNPRFRNLTNPLHTPTVALKYADETGGLSVHAFYHMLFNLGSLMHISMTTIKYLTCGYLRSRTVSPN
ncbi:hypothetical protein LDENG_00209710 [Lucifuga dentata]|nr:hypothetical protein LDENG_00209710 [Lucifuga dentata]